MDKGSNYTHINNNSITYCQSKYRVNNNNIERHHEANKQNLETTDLGDIHRKKPCSKNEYTKDISQKQRDMNQ